jgi:hypothetical protein
MTHKQKKAFIYVALSVGHYRAFSLHTRYTHSPTFMQVLHNHKYLQKGVDNAKESFTIHSPRDRTAR